MKTESIISMMNDLFGENSYTEENYAEIDTLHINRFDIDNELLEVNFDDILLFPNVKDLYIENCMIDSENINYIVNNNIEKLYLINCDVVDDITDSVQYMTGKRVFLDNVDINLSILSNVVFNSLTLRSVVINPGNILNANYLDIQKCEIKDLSVLDNDVIDTIVVSFEQYNSNSEYFDNLCKKVIVMEDNGQFEYKRVGW